MNGAHLHLVLNHLPIAAFLFADLGLIIALLRKNTDHQRLALLCVFAAGILTVPAFWSGGMAAHVLKHLQMAGINKDMIHEHALAGDWGLRSGLISGFAAAMTLWLPWVTSARFKKCAIAVLVISLWATSIFLRTAYLGGQIHHPELSITETTATP
jgi:uncharacterized membrane protein